MFLYVCTFIHALHGISAPRCVLKNFETVRAIYALFMQS
jgi:hypothetical protein